MYADQQPGSEPLDEAHAYPAGCPNEYGWEKLYAERLYETYARNGQFETRIARFGNCYGPEAEYRGGREKAPAALCRKARKAAPGAALEIWGDGSAVRSFIHISDLVEGIRVLMASGEDAPTNICSSEPVTVLELARAAIRAARKKLSVQHVDGPVGVLYRLHSAGRMEALGWKPRVALQDGIRDLYAWISEQAGMR